MSAASDHEPDGRAKPRDADAVNSRSRGRKAIVLAVVTACFALTLLGFGASLGRAWIAVLAVLPGGLAALSLRRRSIPEALPLGATELAVAAASLLLQLLSFAFFTWLLYWLLRWAFALVDAIGGFEVDEDAIAFWAAFALLGLVFLAFSVTAARNVADALYPAAGLRSPYAGFFRGRGGRLLVHALGGGVLIGLAVVFFDVPGNDAGTALFLCLLLVALVVAPPRRPSRSPEAVGPAADRVIKSFRRKGWTVVPRPQTGDPGIDPLLAQIDLFAHKDAQSVLVLVQVPRVNRGQAAMEWIVSTSVVTAVGALPKTELPAGVERSDGVVFVLNAKPEPALERFARGHGLSIVVLDETKRTAQVLGAEHLREELQAVGELALSPAPEGAAEATVLA